MYARGRRKCVRFKPAPDYWRLQERRNGCSAMLEGNRVLSCHYSYHFGPLQIQELTSCSWVYRGGHLCKELSWPPSSVLALELPGFRRIWRLLAVSRYGRAGQSKYRGGDLKSIWLTDDVGDGVILLGRVPSRPGCSYISARQSLACADDGNFWCTR